MALHEAVTAFAQGQPVTIKWPNDLMVAGAKLSGILLERAGDAVVIGFGVNLAHHPEGLDRPATSLARLMGSAPEPQAFAETLAECFARWLLAAHPVGTALSAQAGSMRIEGLFEGLDETGALCLRLADGTHHVMHAGDVFLI